MRNTTYVLLLICFFMLVLFTSVLASEDTEIYCYTVNPPDYVYIGTVEVFKVADATSTCNIIYYNCHEKCIGCYINPESIELCIDKNGNQFVKE